MTSTGTASTRPPSSSTFRPTARQAQGRQVHALLASPLRYPGMPADRLWEMEDAQVNLGVVESEPWDLARLLVSEFALTYGNDWLVVPVDVPFGSLVAVESLIYTTTFGERFKVEDTATVSPDGKWRMFTRHRARRRLLGRAPGAAGRGRRTRRTGRGGGVVPARRDGEPGVGGRAQRPGPQRPRSRPRPRARRPDADPGGTGRNEPSWTTSCRPAFPPAGSPTFRPRPATAPCRFSRAGCPTPQGTRSPRSAGCSIHQTYVWSPTRRSPAKACSYAGSPR